MAQTMTTMGSDAELIVYHESNPENPSSVSFDDGNSPERVIAVQDSGGTREDFMWLVNAAASFHCIPVREYTQ